MAIHRIPQPGKPTPGGADVNINLDIAFVWRFLVVSVSSSFIPLEY